MRSKFSSLQSKLGYCFTDESVLTLSLSHRSVGQINNERFEFLGDSLLNLIVSEALFHKFPRAKEGDLSRLRAHLVKGERLAEIARELGLGEYLLLGGGELKSGGYRRSSILANTVEALIGAIYLDSQSFISCKNCVLSWYQNRLDSISLEIVKKDAKTRLQEFMQERGKRLPKYTVVEELGKSHSREYRVECALSGEKQVFSAVGSSKQTAEKHAATQALIYLGLETS